MIKISVIIPTLNEEKYLGITLHSLRRQKFKDFEIIVSDGNSSDKTVEIARTLADKIVRNKKRGISHQRNKGVEVACGELLVFTDADTLHPDNWLLKIVKEFDGDKRLVGIAGNVFPLSTKRRVLVSLSLINEYSKKISHRIRFYFAAGANLACRKTAFESVGGFSEDLETREDTEFMMRLARFGSVKFCSDIIIWSSDRRAKLGKIKWLKYFLDNLKFLVTKQGMKYEPAR